MTIRFGQSAACIVTLFALAGCEEGFGNLTPTPEETAGDPQVSSVMKDVERPDIFNTEEKALWDGRPSLGGIWVAHPDVTDPERVLIRNTENGQEIAGALFRRERNNPGPRIQLSSDAAAALGILAGQPTDLSIIVVRQEEVIIEAPAVISEEDIGETVEGEEALPVDGEEGIVDDLAVGAAAGAAAAAPKKKGFFARLRDSLSNKPAEEDTVFVEDITESGSGDAIETVTLDPVTTAAAAAIATAEADDKPKPRPSRSEARAAPAPQPAAAAPAGLKNPFVQVGLFSVEANASSAAASLRQAGIVPSVVKDGDAWRVVIGPMATADDQAAILGQVRTLGYKDAFLTSK